MSIDEQLVQWSKHYGWPLLDTDQVGRFVAANPRTVLFIAGDTKKFPESQDVAVILNLILAEYPGLEAGLVARDGEVEIMEHCGVRQWPSLIFYADGKLLGHISRVQDWQDYLARIEELFGLPAAIPQRSIPDKS